jgi:phage/plasmid-like protein (TIGR03299 family)
MFSLDKIIDATEKRNGSPDIIAEEHDINKINTDGMSGGGVQSQIDYLKGGGFWDQNEYGISREAQIAKLEAANTPEAQERELAKMRKRAIARAGLDTSNNRVNLMVAGSAALAAHWTKLGVSVREAVNSKQAQRLSGLGFHVDKVQQYFKLPDGTEKEAEGQFSLYRTDTGAYTGSVGSRYQVIQNDDAFAFLDHIIGKYGARYETAGSVFGGKRVWMQIELPQQSFEVVKGDEVKATAIFTNPHDGSGKAWCFATNQRAVCANTLRRSMGEKHKGIGMRHTGDIKQRVADAQKALGLAVHGFEKAKVEAQTLVHTPVRANAYFHDVLDSILDVTQAQANLGAVLLTEEKCLELAITTTEGRDKVFKEFRKAIEYRTTVLDDILNRYESERCGIGGIRGTAWSAVQAVVESADHGRLGQPLRRVGTEQEQASRRFEDALAGEVDDFKQVGYAQALALASN